MKSDDHRSSLALHRSDADIRAAVNDWCSSDNDREKRTEVLLKYGNISDWVTTKVTNCKELFQDKFDFNDDISRWDVSNVEDMSDMFHGCASFNQNLEKWDIQKVASMAYMFWAASSLSFQELPKSWDISSVKDTRNMFDTPDTYHVSAAGRAIHGGKPPHQTHDQTKR